MLLVKDQHISLCGFSIFDALQNPATMSRRAMGSALKGQDLCSSEFNSRIGMHEIKVPEYIGQLRLIFNLTERKYTST